MKTHTVRRTTVTLPALDEAGVYLSNVTALDGGRGRTSDFQYADADLRDLDLDGVHLLDGRITNLQTQRAHIHDVQVHSVEFAGCNFGALQWSGSKLSRVVFTDCKLMGADFQDVTLDNVLFDKCRFDYASFTGLRVSGPVIFSGCSLREAKLTASDLGSVLLDACDLRLTEFGGGRYKDCDLRGNDLSAILGARYLKQIVIDRAQTLQLAEALAAELEITFGEDLDDA